MKRQLGYFYRHFEELACAGLVIAMSLLVIGNVLLRYLLGTSISWAEEVATICFVWLVFLGASAAYKHKMDIGIDVLVQRLPMSWQRVITLITRFILLILNSYIFYISVVFTLIAWPKPTAVMGVSSAVVNSALVVAFALISLHTLRCLVQDINLLAARTEAS